MFHASHVILGNGIQHVTNEKVCLTVSIGKLGIRHNDNSIVVSHTLK